MHDEPAQRKPGQIFLPSLARLERESLKASCGVEGHAAEGTGLYWPVEWLNAALRPQRSTAELNGRTS